MGLEQVVHIHTEDIGDLHQHEHIGGHIAPLPFGDGFVRVVQFFPQLRLRHTGGQTQPDEIAGNGGLAFVHNSVPFTCSISSIISKKWKNVK